ncbi:MULTISPECIES: helix-turn-helix domain-containing protein [Providencia]|uniref:helix-turn-helix domain-containing protein n=1 Tax=Providencia TaxID=586 RepID=UPI000D889FD7|nr:helix-turn-helix transcriptional regulator [Providencia rettgeri]MBG5927772.1 helix-turn-helix domain-containing protein [Providencia rettgeri]MBS0861586.1 helix-turn-helix domain-containing protein [Providencia rettgeri]MBS0872930.1 helix-turn-helix domain-containing protein [Providencia rettgeri]MBS0922642.1 helix-turn-helix domain-containing protein [Providencia rettgeri]SPZ22735.1 Helix-turn-helix domain [Providencia rettgeri]
MNIGKKLRLIREAEGLSREQLSELIDVPIGTMRRYETGRIENVGSDTVVKILSKPMFEKYALWLVTGKTNESAGQIAPSLSPDGHENTQDLLKVSNAGK